MTRTDVLALAALVLVLGIFFGPAVFGDRAVFTWNMDLWLPWAASAEPSDLERPARTADCARQFAVMRALSNEALTAGRIPLWNRWIFSGTPFLANFQPGVFYPPNLALAFSGLSLPDQMTTYVILHLLIGATGVFALLRSTGCRPAAAWIGAFVYAMAAPSISRTGLPTLVSTICWLPWAMFASRRWFSGGGGGSWAAMAGALGLSGLAGFAQLFVFTAYGWAGFGLIDGLLRRPRPGWRIWAGWACAGALGLALVAVHLVPTLEFMTVGQDAKNTPEMLASGTLHPWVLGKAVVPDLLGNPADGNNATHHLRVGEGYYFQTEWTTALYAGLLPLLLATIVVLSPGDPRRATLAALLLAGLGLLFCFRTPLTGLVTKLPGLDFSRPDRATILWSTGVALLAGLGAERLASSEGPGWRRPANAAAITAGALLTAFAIAMLLGATRWLPADVVKTVGEGALRRAAGIAAATGAVVTALVALRAAGRIGPSAFLALAAAIVVADVGWVAARINVMHPKESIYRPAAPGGGLEFLREGIAAGGLARIFRWEPNRSQFVGVLPPSTASQYGIEDAIGFDSMNTARYQRLMQTLDPSIVVKRGNFRGAKKADVFASPLLDVLNVRFVLAGGPADLPGLTEVHRSDLVVFENPDAVPRAYLVGTTRSIDDPDRLLEEMARPGFRPDLEALVEGSFPGWEGSPPGSGDAAETSAPGSARIVHYADERVEIEVSPERACLLVLADAHFPGWKAFVDGEERPIHRVNYLQRGVSVKPEDRTVVFSYQPSSFRTGAAVSLAALALVVVGAVTLRGRRA